MLDGGDHVLPLGDRDVGDRVLVVLLGLGHLRLGRAGELELGDLGERRALRGLGAAERRRRRRELVRRPADEALNLGLVAGQLDARLHGLGPRLHRLRLRGHGPRGQELLDLLRDRSDHPGDRVHRVLLGRGRVLLRVEGALLNAVPSEEQVAHEGHVAQPGAERPRGALGAEALPLGEPGRLPLREQLGRLVRVPERPQRAPRDEGLRHRGAEAHADRRVVFEVAHDPAAQVVLDGVGGVLGLELGLRLLRPLVGGEGRVHGLRDHRLHGRIRGGGGVVGGGVGGRDGGVHRLYLT